MEDWQGCLSPSCQAALRHAQQSVEGRGGYAITVEDFLLSLLDCEPSLVPFLKQHGVDQDELVRTIQCEQPIVTSVSGEDVLTSQLQYLFSMAREQHSGPWLHWPALLQALTESSERLQGKAYVAVLEQVGAWPVENSESVSATPKRAGESPPIVVSDSNWLSLAEDIAVAMTADPKALVWLSGEAGAGKTSWLESLIPLLPDVIRFNLRAEREETAIAGLDAPVERTSEARLPALLLDQVSPADLVEILSLREHLASQFLPAYDGPMLLVSRSGPDDQASVHCLQRLLGRSLSRYPFPAPSKAQLLAVLTAHQPRIEKRWGVEVCLEVLPMMAKALARTEATPGQALDWLERTAARLAIRADKGPWEARRLAAEEAVLRRQQLVALARNAPVTELDSALQQLSVESAACEVSWEERRAAGALRQVTIADVLAEREHGVRRDGVIERRHLSERRVAERRRMRAVT
ncbi:MAG: hypothetical protein R3276_05455 [Marinobacter sp.]|nr:hypothetical protein [Marinobacter sp.]